MSGLEQEFCWRTDGLPPEAPELSDVWFSDEGKEGIAFSEPALIALGAGSFRVARVRWWWESGVAHHVGWSAGDWDYDLGTVKAWALIPDPGTGEERSDG